MTLWVSQPASIRCRWPSTTGANAIIRIKARTAAAASHSCLCARTGAVSIAASCTRGCARYAFPLGLLQLQSGMTHKQMPDDGLESFGMRRDGIGIDRRHNADGVADLGRVA